MTPNSQKNKSIGFVLWDEEEKKVFQDGTFYLPLRPEELSYELPSRNSVQQTLGGAWLDSFGRGVDTITLSGNTSWRGTETEDGSALFQKLRNRCFLAWHQQRAIRQEHGRDPDDVQLIYSDHLNDLALVVAPMRFVLKRQKSRPLLSQYQIALTVLAEVGKQPFAAEPIANSISNPRGRFNAAQTSLSASASRVKALAVKMKELSSPITGALEAFVALEAKVLSEVQAVADEAVGVFDAVSAPLLYTSQLMSQAGRNAFLILTEPLAVTEHAKAILRETYTNFNDAFCTLRNGYNLLRRFTDFEDLFGASTCSSTAGGRPISRFADSNAFEELYRQGPAPLTATKQAQDDMQFLAGDPLASGASVTEIGRRLGNIASGVAV